MVIIQIRFRQFIRFGLIGDATPFNQLRVQLLVIHHGEQGSLPGLCPVVSVELVGFGDIEFQNVGGGKLSVQIVVIV